MVATHRLFWILALALAVSVGGALMVVDAKPASASGATINCTMPLQVVCEISSPKGIKHVTVILHAGSKLGDVEVVDKDFRCAKEVEVTFDPIGGLSQYSIHVEECTALGISDMSGRGEPVEICIVEGADICPPEPFEIVWVCITTGMLAGYECPEMSEGLEAKQVIQAISR